VKTFEMARLGRADYADLICAEICKKNGMYFFTDDSDIFYCDGVEFITGNPWCLRNMHHRTRFCREAGTA
ncbi:MAG: hypothetical protein ABJJ38_19595, partial [Roseibium sp.]